MVEELRKAEDALRSENKRLRETLQIVLTTFETEEDADLAIDFLLPKVREALISS